MKSESLFMLIVGVFLLVEKPSIMTTMHKIGLIFIIIGISTFVIMQLVGEKK